MKLLTSPSDNIRWSEVERELRGLHSCRSIDKWLTSLQQASDILNFTDIKNVAEKQNLGARQKTHAGYEIRDSGVKNKFEGLKYYIENRLTDREREELLSVTLPHIVNRALSISRHWPSGGLPVLQQLSDTSVILSRQLVAAIIACGFLCLFPPCCADDEAKHNDINFSLFFTRLVDKDAQCNKLTYIFSYFSQLSKTPDGPSGFITFERHVVVSDLLPGYKDWLECRKSLCPIRVFTSGSAEEPGKDKLQVVLGSRLFGGSVLVAGRKREDVKFCVLTELIAGMLFIEAPLDNETLLVRGLSLFCRTGSTAGLRYTGPFWDDALKTPNTSLTAPQSSATHNPFLIDDLESIPRNIEAHTSTLIPPVSAGNKCKTIKPLKTTETSNPKDETNTSENAELCSRTTCLHTSDTEKSKQKLSTDYLESTESGSQSYIADRSAASETSQDTLRRKSPCVDDTSCVIENTNKTENFNSNFEPDSLGTAMATVTRSDALFAVSALSHAAKTDKHDMVKELGTMTGEITVSVVDTLAMGPVGEVDRQYQRRHILRELNKLLISFKGPALKGEGGEEWDLRGEESQARGQSCGEGVIKKVDLEALQPSHSNPEQFSTSTTSSDGPPPPGAAGAACPVQSPQASKAGRLRAMGGSMESRVLSGSGAHRRDRLLARCRRSEQGSVDSSSSSTADDVIGSQVTRTPPSHAKKRSSIHAPSSRRSSSVQFQTSVASDGLVSQPSISGDYYYYPGTRRRSSAVSDVSGRSSSSSASAGSSSSSTAGMYGRYQSSELSSELDELYDSFQSFSVIEEEPSTPGYTSGASRVLASIADEENPDLMEGFEPGNEPGREAGRNNDFTRVTDLSGELGNIAPISQNSRMDKANSMDSSGRDGDTAATASRERRLHSDSSFGGGVFGDVTAASLARDVRAGVSAAAAEVGAVAGKAVATAVRHLDAKQLRAGFSKFFRRADGRSGSPRREEGGREDGPGEGGKETGCDREDKVENGVGAAAEVEGVLDVQGLVASEEKSAEPEGDSSSAGSASRLSRITLNHFAENVVNTAMQMSRVELAAKVNRNRRRIGRWTSVDLVERPTSAMTFDEGTKSDSEGRGETRQAGDGSEFENGILDHEDARVGSDMLVGNLERGGVQPMEHRWDGSQRAGLNTFRRYRTPDQDVKYGVIGGVDEFGASGGFDRVSAGIAGSDQPGEGTGARRSPMRMGRYAMPMKKDSSVDSALSLDRSTRSRSVEGWEPQFSLRDADMLPEENPYGDGYVVEEFINGMIEPLMMRAVDLDEDGRIRSSEEETLMANNFFESRKSKRAAENHGSNRTSSSGSSGVYRRRGTRGSGHAAFVAAPVTDSVFSHVALSDFESELKNCDEASHRHRLVELRDSAAMERAGSEPAVVDYGASGGRVPTGDWDRWVSEEESRSPYAFKFGSSDDGSGQSDGGLPVRNSVLAGRDFVSAGRDPDHAAHNSVNSLTRGRGTDTSPCRKSPSSERDEDPLSRSPNSRHALDQFAEILSTRVVVESFMTMFGADNRQSSNSSTVNRTVETRREGRSRSGMVEEVESLGIGCSERSNSQILGNIWRIPESNELQTEDSLTFSQLRNSVNGLSGLGIVDDSNADNSIGMLPNNSAGKRLSESSPGTVPSMSLAFVAAATAALTAGDTIGLDVIGAENSFPQLMPSTDPVNQQTAAVRLNTTSELQQNLSTNIAQNAISQISELSSNSQPSTLSHASAERSHSRQSFDGRDASLRDLYGRDQAMGIPYNSEDIHLVATGATETSDVMGHNQQDRMMSRTTGRTEGLHESSATLPLSVASAPAASLEGQVSDMVVMGPIQRRGTWPNSAGDTSDLLQYQAMLRGLEGGEGGADEGREREGRESLPGVQQSGIAVGSDRINPVEHNTRRGARRVFGSTDVTRYAERFVQSAFIGALGQIMPSVRELFNQHQLNSDESQCSILLTSMPNSGSSPIKSLKFNSFNPNYALERRTHSGSDDELENETASRDTTDTHRGAPNTPRGAVNTLQGAIDLERGLGGIMAVSTEHSMAGAFHNEPQLLALMQWISASVAGVPSLSYYTHSNPLLAQMETVAERVALSGVTVGALLREVDLWCRTMSASPCPGHLQLFDFLFYRLDSLN